MSLSTLKVAIATGLGKEGIDKEALKTLEIMFSKLPNPYGFYNKEYTFFLVELTGETHHLVWGTIAFTRKVFGVVLSKEVENKHYLESIFKDLGFLIPVD